MILKYHTFKTVTINITPPWLAWMCRIYHKIDFKYDGLQCKTDVFFNRGTCHTIYLN